MFLNNRIFISTIDLLKRVLKSPSFLPAFLKYIIFQVIQLNCSLNISLLFIKHIRKLNFLLCLGNLIAFEAWCIICLLVLVDSKNVLCCFFVTRIESDFFEVIVVLELEVLGTFLFQKGLLELHCFIREVHFACLGGLGFFDIWLCLGLNIFFVFKLIHLF